MYKFKCTSCVAFSIILIVLFFLTSVQKSDFYEERITARRILNEPTTNVDRDVSEKIAEITKCIDKDLKSVAKRRGDYWVLYNYVKADVNYKCYESITYTTQGDYQFLDNVMPLIEKWNGPVSIALYAPGYDFKKTVESISYLRSCESELIRKYVTFHVFFESTEMPDVDTGLLTFYEFYEDNYDCSKGAPYAKVKRENTYKEKNNLTYPINVARNIARDAATTHFIFPLDIELYPTKNLIQKFLKMIADHPELHENPTPKVFVLPIFEILENETVPENKTQLQIMYKNKKAFLFHSRICSPCHSVPNGTTWMKIPETDDLDIFTVSKRQGKYKMWEAFYIGTNEEPFFDERLSWEGQSNKMTQAYSMCVLDYDYMVLNNAFLVHKPGIKKVKEQVKKHLNLVGKASNLIRKQIKPEIDSFYGSRKGCYL